MSDRKTITPRRNKRGYRRYRGGTLNVTPIGHEIALVERNAAASPLLRLPPELRARIYGYALGGYTIRPLIGNQAATTSVTPRFALLRVSRQLYQETSRLPSTLNTVEIQTVTNLQVFAYLGILKHVEDIDIRDVHSDTSSNLKNSFPRHLLPNLKRLIIHRLDVPMSEFHYPSNHGVPVIRSLSTKARTALIEAEPALRKHLGDKVVITVVVK